MPFRIAVLVLSSLLIARISRAADWPMYLYDPTHSSDATNETQIDVNNVGNLQAAWTFNGQGFGGGATVMDGVVYIGDWGGNFYALRALDGSMVWKQYAGMAATPGAPTCQPAIGVTGQAVVNNGVVYVPGGDSAVYAFAQRSGKQLWRVPVADPASGSYVWSSLMLSGGSIYFGIASLGDCPLVQGAVVRLDLNGTQSPIIKYLLPSGSLGAGIWSSIAVDQQAKTLYATTGNGDQNAATGSWGSSFLQIDAQTLNVKGSFFLPTVNQVDDDDWGSSPTLFNAADGTPLVGATAKDGVLYVLRRADMSVAWTAQVAIGCDIPQAGCGSLSTPAYDGTALYLGSGQPPNGNSGAGAVYAFNPSNGQQIWFTPLPGTVIAPVTIANGVIYAATLNGLVAIDASSGNVLWDDGNAGQMYGQAVVVDGTVYATYASGALVAYRPDNGGNTIAPLPPHPRTPIAH